MSLKVMLTLAWATLQVAGLIIMSLGAAWLPPATLSIPLFMVFFGGMLFGAGSLLATQVIHLEKQQ